MRETSAVAVGAKVLPSETLGGGEPDGQGRRLGACRLCSLVARSLARSSRRRRDKASASVLARLSKIGVDRNAKDAALASLVAPGVKSIEEMSVVVTGVNDGPAEGLAFGDADPPGTGGPVGSAPLSPAMLADQKAREAKYGTVTLASTTLADTHRRRARSGVAGHRFRQAAHLRRLGRHSARSSAQQDLRSELRQGRAGRYMLK